MTKRDDMTKGYNGTNINVFSNVQKNLEHWKHSLV